MRKYLIAISIASVMLFLFSGLGFALWRKPIESPEVAAWVQAIGSIAAIGGAVWIYQSQERQRRKQELASAKITAASIIHRIVLIQSELNAYITWLSEVALIDGNPAGFKFHSERLHALPVCSQDELIRLAPLDRDCGLRLSAAFDLIGSAKVMSGVAVIDPRTNNESEVRKVYAATMKKQLEQAQKDLSYVLQDLNAATNSTA